MKTNQNIKKLVFACMVMCVASATWVSCSNDLVEEPFGSVPGTEEHTMVMHLDASRPSYAMNRAASAEWTEGDVIYLRFYQADGTTVICGKALYDASDSLWSVSYYGSLTTGNAYKCEAFYFTDATAEDNYHISLTAMSGIYEDMNGTYMVDNGELFVNATLSPKTARMRFTGEAGQEITVYQVVHHTAFDLAENTFSTASYSIDLQVGEDGYTPYIYGALGEDNEIRIRDVYYEYEKAFDPSKFVAGMSGYIAIPSQTENKGWTQNYYYPGNAVDLGLSVRWSSTNLTSDGGFANDAYDSGVYCAWGDATGTITTTSTSYNRDIDEITGNPDYDIATNLLGERWQIPTQEQWQELIDECTWEYYHSATWGEYGYIVTGPNGNVIRLGMFDYVVGDEEEPLTTQSAGYYWSSTESSPYYGYYIYLTNSSHNMTNGKYKYQRMQIRPVLVK